MSLFNDIFENNKLEDRSGLKYYFEGIPENENERISYTNILVNISLKNNFINEQKVKIDNNGLLEITNNVKSCFKFKDLSQKSFIIDKCLKEINCFDNNEIKNAFKNTINIYNKEELKIMNFDLFVNFCSKLAFLIKENEYLLEFPSIVYYGDIQKARIYFLNFLNNLGINIIIINPHENSPKQMIPLISKLFNKIEFENKNLDFKIPDREIVKTIETNAYKAEQQVNSYYGIQNNEIKDIQNIPIKTSYEDLFNLWSIPINERNGYKIKNNIKYIPNIMCKINGIEKDEDLFRNKLHILQQKSPIIIYDEDILRNYNESEMIGIDKITLSGLKRNVKDIVLKKFLDEEYLKLSLFALKVSKENFYNILQKIDREDYEPKLFIIHNKSEVNEDLLKLNRFYKMCFSIGFDIIMFSPSGYSGIEEIENCNLYELDLYDNKFKINNYNKRNDIENVGFFRKLFMKGNNNG